MSGTPTEAEVQAQWRAAVDVLESLRAHFDGTQAGASGKFDTLLQALEGEYTPSGLSGMVTTLRNGMSEMVSANMATTAIAPVLYEYARLLSSGSDEDGFGSTYRSLADLFRAIHEWFVDNSLTVQSRNITFDTSVTAGASNVGNGALSRLTVDQNGFDLEACRVERKQFQCRSDQNTGANEHAEVFEVMGEPSSPDNLLWGEYGSGDSARRAVTSKHSGSGAGGSLLNNSSFSSYGASSTPKFTGWTETAGGSQISQDTTNFYRSNPSSTTDASLKITGGGGTVTLTQPLTAMRTRRINPDTPYFLRVMLNKTIGSASGGTVTIRLGSQSESVTIAAMAANWTELLIPIGTKCWPRTFTEADMAVEIEWSSSTSGYLLVDDVIFCPWDLIDGTWWLIRGNAATHTSWLVDDVLAVTDTGGALGTGKIQEWLVRGGFGYLPSTTGTPTFTDP
jgi:hypothetical protein